MTYAAHCYASRKSEHPTRRELFGSAVLLSDHGDKLPTPLSPTMTKAPRPIRRMLQVRGSMEEEKRGRKAKKQMERY